MRTKHRMMLQTTVAVFLSINVHVSRDQTNHLLTIPILPLTTFLAWSWSLMRSASGLMENVSQQWTDFQQQLTVGLILMTIGYRSILYGVGVKL